jgi:hypothetical protein
MTLVINGYWRQMIAGMSRMAHFKSCSILTFFVPILSSNIYEPGFKLISKGLRPLARLRRYWITKGRI